MHEVFTRGCFLLVSHRMQILQSSYFVLVLQILVQVFQAFFLQDLAPDYTVSIAKYRGPTHTKFSKLLQACEIASTL